MREEEKDDDWVTSFLCYLYVNILKYNKEEFSTMMKLYFFYKIKRHHFFDIYFLFVNKQKIKKKYTYRKK